MCLVLGDVACTVGLLAGDSSPSPSPAAAADVEIALGKLVLQVRKPGRRLCAWRLHLAAAKATLC